MYIGSDYLLLTTGEQRKWGMRMRKPVQVAFKITAKCVRVSEREDME